MNYAKNLVFMIEPVSFRANEETLKTNAFQKKPTNNENINHLAQEEFNNLIKTLNQYGIQTHVEKDLVERDTPDSIFPNNWVSFHHGVVVLYPMQAENRRRERSLNFIHHIAEKNKLSLDQVIDLSHEESNGKYLEGTGSIVFDHYNKKAYASLSERTDQSLLEDICKTLKYEAIYFNAVDENNFPIYHTNVMMAIGEKFAVICLDSIKNIEEKEKIIQSLKTNNKEIIEISYDQMNHFCGNILQLKGNDDYVIAMSKTAFNHFTEAQKIQLEQHGKIAYSDISTIETHGGGSVRCMICEVA